MPTGMWRRRNTTAGMWRYCNTTSLRHKLEAEGDVQGQLLRGPLDHVAPGTRDHRVRYRRVVCAAVIAGLGDADHATQFDAERIGHLLRLHACRRQRHVAHLGLELR